MNGWTGNGYFRQIKGPEISKAAHIIAVADMFQALSEERPYRLGLETEQVLGIMEERQEATSAGIASIA